MPTHKHVALATDSPEKSRSTADAASVIGDSAALTERSTAASAVRGLGVPASVRSPRRVQVSTRAEIQRSPRQSPRLQSRRQALDDESARSPTSFGNSTRGNRMFSGTRDLGRREPRESHAGLTDINEENLSLNSEEHIDEIAVDAGIFGEREQKTKSTEKKTVRQKLKGLRDRILTCVLASLMILCTEITCHRRKRKHNLKLNEWVMLRLPDRMERQVSLRLKRLVDFQEVTTEWYVKSRAGLLRRRTMYKWYIKLVMANSWESLRFWMQEHCFRVVHKQTGLPKALLEWWHFEKLVFEGPHGYVFLAHDMLHRSVAVKVRDKSKSMLWKLPLHRATRTVQRHMVAAHFQKIQRCLRCFGFGSHHFGHPNIPKMYAVYETSDFFVEVTEFVDGSNLKAYIDDADNSLSEEQICTLFKQILSAIQYMHARRLIHRDIRLCQCLLQCKPMSVAQDISHTKLSDSWMTTRLPSTKKKKVPLIYDQTIPGERITRAPEVLKFGEWSTKADMWAAGCILCELLFGHVPYGGERTALLARIVSQKPEIDLLAGHVSPQVIDLLKRLLANDCAKRLGAAEALEHPWFALFSDGTKKGRMKHTQDHRIRDVRVYGKTPACKKGMEAQNLFGAKDGMFTSGFCTFMGSLSADIVVEIGGEGKFETDHYWVHTIIVSLWGSDDNPQRVSLSGALRYGHHCWARLAVLRVDGKNATEARIKVEKPLRYARISFLGNFGGGHGIAIRKLSFYGYRLCAVPMSLNMTECKFDRGAGEYTHSDRIKEADLTRLDPFVKASTQKGERVPGSGQRYLTFHDIDSGPSHASTCISRFVTLEPGQTIVAAALNLRFASICKPGNTLSMIKIVMEDHAGVRTPLFATPELSTYPFSVEDVMKKGYADLPAMFAVGLSINTDKPMTLEIHCENNGGYVHFPFRFGMTLYYIPETFSSEDSDMDVISNERSARKGRRGGELFGQGDERKDDSKNLKDATPGDALQFLDTNTVDLSDDDSDDHAGSEVLENELKDDFKTLNGLTMYNTYSSDKFTTKEVEQCWDPLQDRQDEEEEEEPKPKVINRWWEGKFSDGTDDEDTSKEDAATMGAQRSARRHVTKIKSARSGPIKLGLQQNVESSSSFGESLRGSVQSDASLRGVTTARHTMIARDAEAKLKSLPKTIESLQWKPREDLTDSEAEWLAGALERREEDRRIARIAAETQLQTMMMTLQRHAEIRSDARHYGRKRVFGPKNPLKGLWDWDEHEIFQECCRCREQTQQLTDGCRQALDTLQALPDVALPFTPPVPPSTPRAGLESLSSVVEDDPEDSADPSSRRGCIVL